MKWTSPGRREQQLKISFVCEFVDWSGHGGLAPKAIHAVMREEFQRAGIPTDAARVTSILAARPQTPVARPPLMRRVAGLTQGEDEQATIRARYGHGYFVEGEGHTGGLYYLSPDRRLMLHVELGEGYRIERLDLLSAELFPTDFPLTDPDLISSALVGPLDNEFGLQIGMTPDQVKSRFPNLSPGHDHQGRDTLSFSVDGESDDRVAYYELTFVFVEKRLAGIQLYDGE